MTANADLFLFDFEVIEKRKDEGGIVYRTLLYVRNIFLFYTVNKILKQAIQNTAVTLKVYGIDTLDRIDELLIRIETAMEMTEELFESKELKGWHNAPVRWMARKAYSRGATFEILVSSLYAKMMQHEKHIKNTKI